MKALRNFDNKDKLKLLHDLFPDEIPIILDRILEFCEDFKKNVETYEKTWNNGFMPINYWLNLSEETATIIREHKIKMVKSSHLFSDQLSSTYVVLFVNDRIIKYGKETSADHKFKVAVELLF